MVDARIVNAVIASASGLTGVALGLGYNYWRDTVERRRRHQSYWAALSAEVEECAGLAGAYDRDPVQAPLYRLPDRL